MTQRFLLGAVLAATLAACGGSDGGSTSPNNGPPATTVTVRATPALQFTPATVTVAVGGTVTFAFEGVAHDVFFDGAPPGAPTNIATPTANTSISRTFPTAGRYAYNCHVHPGMSGVIVVQ